MAGATRSWSTGRDVIPRISAQLCRRCLPLATNKELPRQGPRPGPHRDSTPGGGVPGVLTPMGWARSTWFRRGEEFTGTMRPLTFQFHDAPRPRGSLGPKVPIYS